MYLNTRIYNPTDISRRYFWVEKNGVWVDPDEVKVVQGGYPTACVDAARRSQLENDLREGNVEITLLTDIPVRLEVSQETNQPMSRPDPVPAQKTPEKYEMPGVTVDMGEVPETPSESAEAAQTREEVFSRLKPGEEAPQLPDKVSLDGSPEPVFIDRPMFRDASGQKSQGDGTSMFRSDEHTVGGVDSIRDKPSEKPAEKAPPPPSKPSSRRRKGSGTRKTAATTK